MAKEKGKIILAEFGSPTELLKAASKLRDAGYKSFDCHSPFPIHGLNQAMGIGRSKLAVFAGIAAAIGFTIALAMQYWMSTIDYPLIVSGKPFNSYPAYTPVTFALAVLLAAFASFFGMLFLSKLPRFNHPLFESEKFEKFSDDSFFISVESNDPGFDSEKTSAFLKEIGGKNLEVLGE
jgi:hypothetical protein